MSHQQQGYIHLYSP